MKPETMQELNQFVEENAGLFASDEDAKRNKPLYVAVHASKLGVLEVSPVFNDLLTCESAKNIADKIDAEAGEEKEFIGFYKLTKLED